MIKRYNLMQLKILTYKLFFLIFVFSFFKNFSFGNTIFNKNSFFKNAKSLQNRFYSSTLKDSIFLKKKNIFYFWKTVRNVFL